MFAKSGHTVDQIQPLSIYFGLQIRLCRKFEAPNTRHLQFNGLLVPRLYDHYDCHSRFTLASLLQSQANACEETTTRDERKFKARQEALKQFNNKVFAQRKIWYNLFFFDGLVSSLKAKTSGTTSLNWDGLFYSFFHRFLWIFNGPYWLD